MSSVLSFFLIYGLSIIVAIIIALDFFKKAKLTKPNLKWVVVILLSLAQFWVWQAIDSFDVAFGNSASFEIEMIVFSTIIVGWFLMKLSRYYQSKSST